MLSFKLESMDGGNEAYDVSCKKWDEFRNAIAKSVQISQTWDYNCAEALAADTYDGTLQSFDIACGNVSSSPYLRCYGSRTLALVLCTLSSLFDRFSLSTKSRIVLSHYGNVLLTISNTSEQAKEFAILDIANIIDNADTSIASESLEDMVNASEHAWCQRVKKQDQQHHPSDRKNTFMKIAIYAAFVLAAVKLTLWQ